MGPFIVVAVDEAIEAVLLLEEVIGCWLGGSIGFQAERLIEYFGDDVSLRDPGYLASEGSMTIPCEDNKPQTTDYGPRTTDHGPQTIHTDDVHITNSLLKSARLLPHVSH